MASAMMLVAERIDDEHEVRVGSAYLMAEWELINDSCSGRRIASPDLLPGERRWLRILATEGRHDVDDQSGGAAGVGDGGGRAASYIVVAPRCETPRPTASSSASPHRPRRVLLHQDARDLSRRASRRSRPTSIPDCFATAPNALISGPLISGARVATVHVQDVD